jgi:hypothetical protein
MMENCFNRWKMFLKAKLKRAMLIEAIRHIVNQLEVRLVNDADTIQRNVQKGHFIDMRKEPPDTGSDPHKKRRSTWLVFQIENIKSQDVTCCAWSEAVALPDKMWLLQEKVEKGGRERVEDCVRIHVVSLRGFLWKDCPENVPPECFTCQTFLSTKCPCVGIQRVLLNVQPDDTTVSLSQWLLKGGKGLLKPEIFNNRLRIDKDPTRFFPQYLQVARRPTADRPTDAPHRTVPAVVTTQDVGAVYDDLCTRISSLDIKVQHGANIKLLHHLRDFDRFLHRFELDTQVAVTCQGRSMPSRIVFRRPGAGGASNKRNLLPKHAGTDADRSSVGLHMRGHSQAGQEDSVIYTAPSSAGTVRSRRPPGVSKGDADDWHCQLCIRSVKNDSNTVGQHCRGTKHLVNVKAWGTKPLVPYLCRFCLVSIDTTMNGADDAKKIRAHNRLSTHLEAVKKATAHVPDAAPRTWTCDTCKLDMPADPEVVNAHNASHEHLRLTRMTHNEQHRPDGQVLADAQRATNAAEGAATQKTSRKRPKT